MATIKDIAKLSGYSIGTVSRVINGHPDVSDTARAAVQNVIREQNYQPNTNAKHLKQQAGTAVTIVVRGYANIFFGKMLEMVQSILTDSGEDAAVVYLDEDANEVQYAIQLAKDRRPKGFIFLGGNLEYFKKDFHRIDVPSVLLTNTAEELHMENLSSFTTDDEAAGYEVIRHLIEAGHQKIGIIGGSSSKDGSQVGYRRMVGCRRAFQEQQIVFDESLQYESSRFSVEDGYDAARRLLNRDAELTAVFAISDSIAIGAMRAIVDMGLKVPEDVTVVGYDGIDMTRFTVPRLATVRQNIEEMARRGVEDLLLRLNYARPASHAVIPFEFINGESLSENHKARP